MTRKRKILIGVAVVVVLGVVAARTLRPDRGVEVRVEAVEKREVIATITAIGQIRARQQVNVSSEVMGRVVQLTVVEGDHVEEGQVLLTIDPKQVQAAVARAEASLSQAEAQVTQQRANLQQSERELVRLVELQAGGITTVQDLEAAETRVQVQRANLTSSLRGVDQARAALEESSEQLSRTTIRAPISGRVMRLNIKAGETAVVGTMNNAGSLLLTIADLSGVEAVLTLDETDIPKISVGDSAVVGVDAFPDRTFAARVYSIANSAKQTGNAQAGGSVNFEVILSILDPTAELRPDLSATADLIVARRLDALSVPIISVTTRDLPGGVASPADTATGRAASTGPIARSSQPSAETGVFMVRAGKAVWTPVTYGITGQGHFEILSGVSVGDTVVSGPYQAIRALQDGNPVRVSGPLTSTP